MYQLFNKRILQIIPIVFLIVITFRIIYTYADTQEKEYEFAKNEAQALNGFAVAHRDYYQKLYINKTIPLNAKTLQGLPAYSSFEISNNFSQNNPFNITIRTVSDRARNEKNNANTDELEAINYFKKNSSEKIFYKKVDDSFFHYASVLRIEQKCLKCHAKKEDAPLFIREKYDKAYDYKLGEVRGILSIKIPVEGIDKYFMNYFYQSVFYDFILFILLFVAVAYLINKSKRLNSVLEYKIKEKTNELEKQLVQERLTKLPNRMKLFIDLDKIIDFPNRHLALINVDRFKEINDFYGHKVGDLILINLGKEIKKFCYSKRSTVYKLPSDEFAILSNRNISERSFYQIIQDLSTKINESKFEIDDHSIFLNISAGIASNDSELLTKADMALQSAKKDTNKLVVKYDESLDISKNIIKNIAGIKILKEAIAKNKIVPFYQPIYNLKTKKIQKYETLARIITDNGEIIAPFAFLDIAKKSKLYPHITHAIITKAFDFFADKDYEFSINLSIDDIYNKETVKFLIQKIADFNNPHRIVFEILESEKVGNYKELTKFISKIKGYGCKFAIDDFGSGYSNFSHIFELNVDYLKIDASLVKYVTTDENSRIITKTIINFATSLGLQTIAEFVEDKDSLDLLEKMGVDFIQGYYIGKPEAHLNNKWN